MLPCEIPVLPQVAGSAVFSPPWQVMSPKGSASLQRVHSLTLMSGLVFFFGLCLRKSLSGSRAGSGDIHSGVGTADHLCAKFPFIKGC